MIPQRENVGVYEKRVLYYFAALLFVLLLPALSLIACRTRVPAVTPTSPTVGGATLTHTPVLHSATPTPVATTGSTSALAIVVTDRATDHPIASARVVVSREGFREERLTDDAGQARFEGLVDTTYDVVVEAAGYQPHRTTVATVDEKVYEIPMTTLVPTPTPTASPTAPISTPTPTASPTISLPTPTPTASPTAPIPTATPTVSPSGRLLIWSFSLEELDTFFASVVVMNADGSDAIELASQARDAAWSPDGRQVVFSLSTVGPNIYLAEVDGSSLPRPLSISGWSMTWSPDGQYIAFDLRDPDSRQLDVFVAKPDGSSLLNLTNSPEYDELYPSWSPDSWRIAFVREQEVGVNALGFVSVDGTDLKFVELDGYVSIYDAKWSPDGVRIAFRDQGKLYVLDVDDLSVVGVTPEGFLDREYDWSPDGQRIVVARREDKAETPPPRVNLCIINVDGSNPQWVTFFGDDSKPQWKPFFDKVFGAREPAWSPDGQWIAFSASGFDVYIVDVEGKNLVPVTQTQLVFEGRPLWAPSSTKP